MKKFQLMAIVFVLGLFASAFKGVDTDSYKVDTAASTIAWTGKKVTGQHTGNISLQSGELVFGGGKLKGGNFVVDMGTITCTDLDGEWGTKLVGHLNSDDFFGVANHSTAKLVIKKAKLKSANTYEVKGDLTIKGTTEEVVFDAEVSEADGKVTATAQITVDRTKYGIKYGSGSFFDGLGDKMIDDNFILDVTLVAQAAM